jgi:hypothetical protein
MCSHKVTVLKTDINVLLVTLSTPLEEIIRVLNSEFSKDQKVLCLSTHSFFDPEKEDITKNTNRMVIFETFCQFISESEMVACDEQADLDILENYGNRDGNLQKYYNRIKWLKNSKIHDNVSSSYNIIGGFILSNDLGICKDAWTTQGFIDVSLDEEKKFSINSLSAVKYVSTIVAILRQPICVLHYKDEKSIFFGQSKRLGQFLGKDVVFKDISKLDSLTLRISLLLLVFSKKFLFFKKISTTFISIYVNNFTKKYNYVGSSTHEFLGLHGLLAKEIKLKMNVFQDGLLPGNYTSKYLLYYINVDLFFVWDEFSCTIFRENALNYRVSSMYKRQKINSIGRVGEIKNILILASGAGDWTALKDRSDEDLAFMALVKSAKMLSDKEFIFRPHPLWENKQHQGIGSIARLVNYVKKYDFPNFMISTNILHDTAVSKRRNTLSWISKNIDDEIDKADVVIGDHSQTLFNAARKGKIIASLNSSKRRSLFEDYTNLGFPLLRSDTDIVNFIQSIENTSFLGEYNLAIANFNDIHLKSIEE